MSILQFVCVLQHELPSVKKIPRGGTDVSSPSLKWDNGPSQIQKQQQVALKAPTPGCPGESLGVAVGVEGGPQIGDPLAQVAHELEHGGGQAGLDEVAREAALTPRHKHGKAGFYSTARADETTFPITMLF